MRENRHGKSKILFYKVQEHLKPFNQFVSRQKKRAYELEFARCFLINFTYAKLHF